MKNVVDSFKTVIEQIKTKDQLSASSIKVIFSGILGGIKNTVENYGFSTRVYPGIVQLQFYAVSALFYVLLATQPWSRRSRACCPRGRWCAGRCGGPTTSSTAGPRAASPAPPPCSPGPPCAGRPGPSPGPASGTPSGTGSATPASGSTPTTRR